MKQFIYRPEHAGLSEWPSGTLRLEGIDVTENPQEADVFVCPGNIRIFEKVIGSGILDHEKLYRLPYLKGNESRTAFFDCSDNFKTSINLPLLFLRCDLRQWMIPNEPNSVQLPWPVEPYDECIELPAGGKFLFDVSFQGWISSDVRRNAAESCLTTGFGVESLRLKCDIACYKDFCGYIYDQPEGVRRRAEFRRSMRESRIMLCGESIPGVLPYRFFEALSAGRVPMLVSSDYVLPFDSDIPYDQFILRSEASEAHCVGSVIKKFLQRTPDEKLVEMGKLGRHYWAQLLDARQWPRIMGEAVKAKLAQVEARA